MINFISVLATSAIIEEVLFRGILWGVLKNLNRKEVEIIFIQAVLFSLFHFERTYWFSSFVAIPVTGVVFGLLVYKTGSVNMSIATHAGFNTALLIISGIW